MYALCVLGECSASALVRALAAADAVECDKPDDRLCSLVHPALVPRALPARRVERLVLEPLRDRLRDLLDGQEAELDERQHHQYGAICAATPGLPGVESRAGLDGEQ